MKLGALLLGGITLGCVLGAGVYTWRFVLAGLSAPLEAR